MKRGKTIKNRKDQSDAVSEIMGSVLLLAIAVAVFSTLYLNVLSYPPPSSSPTVTLVGTVNGNTIIIEHRGGGALGLSTEILITIGDSSEKIRAEDYLDDEAKQDGLWNIGEQLVYPFQYDLNHREAELMAVDVESNSLIMTGTLNIYPECDIGVVCTVTNQRPIVGSTIELSITTTHYRGDIDATGVAIEINIPGESLSYLNHTATQGSYNHETRMWDVGGLAVGESATLTILTNVTAIEIPTPTQLAMILDASSSINNRDWNLMRTGLAAAIANASIFPHDGYVELTVIQFGGDKWDRGGGSIIPHARVEIGPLNITEENYATVAQYIRTLERIPAVDGETPIVCGFVRADVLKDSLHYDPSVRQVINLVTDGMPNCVWIPGTYNATWMGNTPSGYRAGKTSAEEGREYILSLLEMTEERDELDSIAVGIGGMYGGPDSTWLRENITWPGNYLWTGGGPPGPGWVREVDTWENFSEAIDETFELLFHSITFTVKTVPSPLTDPNASNNEFSLTIQPQEG